jgi:hypothetical protein
MCLGRLMLDSLHQLSLEAEKNKKITEYWLSEIAKINGKFLKKIAKQYILLSVSFSGDNLFKCENKLYKYRITYKDYKDNYFEWYS